MKRLQKPILAALLCCTIAIAGCSTAWVTTLDDILVAAAPALINILNIIAIAKGAPVNTALEAKITSDATTIKSLANSFAVASVLTAPGVCSQLQAAISTYSADQAQVLSLAQVTDQATQIKIETLSALVAGTVSAVLAVIPNCQQAPAIRASLTAKGLPLPLKSFITSYNAALVTPTGNAMLDKFTKSHQVHRHSKLIRVIALGHSY